MTPHIPYLSILLLLPFITSILIMLIPSFGRATIERNSTGCAFWGSAATFLLSLYLAFHYSGDAGLWHWVERYEWIPSLSIRYEVGIDGLSLAFVLLTTLLSLICVIVSRHLITSQLQSFMAALLMLESLTLGVFIARDLVLFYIFFEAALVPMFLMIGIWGGKERIYAAFKFFLYTFAGSVLFLVSMVWLYMTFHTTHMGILAHLASTLPLSSQQWLWAAIFIAFAIKMPMWPLHTWLPDAHVQAPTAGSMMLAGILLKIGGYGFIRVLMPFFPDASLYFQPLVWVLSVIAIIYGSLVALAQSDIKRIIAYSSVAHMGYVTLGLFTFTTDGMQGACIQMISHGLISAGLFLVIGLLYHRFHTRDMAAYGGIAASMPRLATTAMILTLGSVALPGTSGFIGEFLVLMSAASVSIPVMVAASSGVVLGAWYMLRLYRGVFWGRPAASNHHAHADIAGADYACLLALSGAVILLGLWATGLQSWFEAPIALLHLLFNKG